MSADVVYKTLSSRGNLFKDSKLYTYCGLIELAFSDISRGEQFILSHRRPISIDLNGESRNLPAGFVR